MEYVERTSKDAKAWHRDIAMMMGVSQHAIWNVIHRNTWKHVGTV